MRYSFLLCSLNICSFVRQVSHSASDEQDSFTLSATAEDIVTCTVAACAVMYVL